MNDGSSAEDGGLEDFLSRYGQGGGFENYPRNELSNPAGEDGFAPNEYDTRYPDGDEIDPRDINPSAHFVEPDERPLGPLDPDVDDFLRKLEAGTVPDQPAEPVGTEPEIAARVFRITDIAQYDQSHAPAELKRRFRVDAGLEVPRESKTSLHYAFAEEVGTAGSECTRRIIDNEEFDESAVLQILTDAYKRISNNPELAEAIARGQFRLPDVHDLYEFAESTLFMMREIVQRGRDVPPMYINILRTTLRFMETVGTMIVQSSTEIQE